MSVLAHRPLIALNPPTQLLILVDGRQRELYLLVTITPGVAFFQGGSHPETHRLLRRAAGVAVIGDGLLYFIAGESAAVGTLEEHMDEMALLEGIVVGYDGMYGIFLERAVVLWRDLLEQTNGGGNVLDLVVVPLTQTSKMPLVEPPPPFLRLPIPKYSLMYT